MPTDPLTTFPTVESCRPVRPVQCDDARPRPSDRRILEVERGPGQVRSEAKESRPRMSQSNIEPGLTTDNRLSFSCLGDPPPKKHTEVQ